MVSPGCLDSRALEVNSSNHLKSTAPHLEAIGNATRATEEVENPNLGMSAAHEAPASFRALDESQTPNQTCPAFIVQSSGVQCGTLALRYGPKGSKTHRSQTLLNFDFRARRAELGPVGSML